MNKTFLILLIAILALVGAVGYFAYKNSQQKPMTPLTISPSLLPSATPSSIPVVTTGNSKLQANINSFMESQVTEHALGKENYHCANYLYGYDEKYAYAWVLCQGFVSKPNGDLEQGTGFSGPTRLEYRQPNFQIVGFRQPGNGSLYDPGLRELFPKEFYDKARLHLPNAEVEKLMQEVRIKAEDATQMKAK